MKRIVGIIIITVMMLTMVACGKNVDEAQKDTKGFQVGFGKADITPYSSVPMGVSTKTDIQYSTGYKDTLYSLTTAITDEEDNTLLLIVTDLSWGFYTRTALVREKITEMYGIPGEYIMLGGTHNHSAPAYSLNIPDTDAYIEYWLENVMSSVEDALEDRKPAVMQIGRTQTDNLNFVRRYWLEDGTLLTDKDSSSTPIVSHESEPDEEVQMVRFQREGGKDIYITNWQAHNSLEVGKLTASAEWVGVVREVVETELDAHCMYFQGAAGNLNPISRIEGESTITDSREYGKAVAEYILEASRKEETFTTVKRGPIKVQQMNYADEKFIKDDLSEADKSRPIELSAIAFGDVSIVTFPVEMFDTLGMQIKKESPYKMTLLMGYTNGIHGYLPDKEAFSHGGYEASNTDFLPGAGEEFVSCYLNMLNTLHE